MIRWPVILFALWQASQLALAGKLAGPIMMEMMKHVR